VNGSWPALARVQQLFPRALGEVTDGLLGNPILEMSVDATESDSLLSVLACCFEVVVCKAAVVTMVMLDANAVLLGESLKSVFRSDSLLGCQRSHEMDILQA
jgi:hypothetical protein